MRRWVHAIALRNGGLSARVATLFLLLLALFALFADALASDLPIVLRLDGRLYVLPAVTRPGALRRADNQTLRRTLAGQAGGWAWYPLCEYGPTQHPEILSPPPASPSRAHWLGTDDRGRDVFARVIHGTRTSLFVGLLATLITTALGLGVGLVAGYFRGPVDFVCSRVVELGLAFPTFLLILALVAVVERPALWVIALVIGVSRFPELARLVRAEAARLRELDFVRAARAYGASPLRIIAVHVLPHVMPTVLVSATFGVSSAILIESALSFLGFGVPPPQASWGEVLAQAYQQQGRYWLVVPPGLLIFGTVATLNHLPARVQRLRAPRTPG